MAKRTINQGFEAFHKKITPSSYESGKASSHKASITRRLEEYYSLNRLFYSGSANNGTDVAYLSDVDFFASIPRSNLKDNSITALREIKECLQRRYQSTNIYVDSPAIVLDFGYGVWDTAEVIPAAYVRQQYEKSVYKIPNGNGGWMESSPSLHSSYVSSQNSRLKKKLKPLIRYLKAWKYYCNVPISSFYLELRVTKWMEGESSIVYEIDIDTIFRKLANCELASIQDPKGISGYVSACSSAAKKEEALSKLKSAKRRVQQARDAESEGNTDSAFSWWNLVFSGNFPSINS